MTAARGAEVCFSLDVEELAALGGGARGRRFLPLTLLTLPVLTGSARAGQMNVPLAGLLAHATADLAAAGWWRAAFVGLARRPETPLDAAGAPPLGSGHTSRSS